MSMIELPTKMNNITPNVSPFSTVTNSSQWDASRSRQLLAWISVLLATNGFGTILNMIILLAIFIHPPLRRSSSSPLIAHCIITDLYTTAVVIPMTSIPVYLGPKHPLPTLKWCRYQYLYLYAIYPAGMWAACILAIHRLVATVAPYHFPKLTTKCAIRWMLVIPWLLAVVVAIFPTFEIGYKMAPSPVWGGCVATPVENSTAIYVWTYLIFSLYVPTSAMGFCYMVFLVKTLIDLRRHQNRPLLQRRAEISGMLFLSFLWHCCTIYPSIVFITFFSAVYRSSYPLQLWLRLSANSFSAINPIFCLAASQLFRDGSAEVLSCRWLKRKQKVKPLPPSGMPSDRLSLASGRLTRLRKAIPRFEMRTAP